jgi:hypothetical protein
MLPTVLCCVSQDLFETALYETEPKVGLHVLHEVSRFWTQLIGIKVHLILVVVAFSKSNRC